MLRLKHAILLYAAAGLAAVVSCNLSNETRDRNYISLRLPDSLRADDKVRILLVKPSTNDTLDTLWNAPLEDSAALDRLAAPHYQGGEVDVIIQGLKNGVLVTLTRVEYRNEGNKPVTVTLEIPPSRDTVPPVISGIGSDSVNIHLSAALPQPDMLSGSDICEDDRDGNIPVVYSVVEDSAHSDATRTVFVQTMRCTDRAGNAARPLLRRFYVYPAPDTIKPVLTLRGPDSLVVYQNRPYADSGAVCVDDRDGTLPVTVKGDVNTASPGHYPLTFSCADSAGNAAADKLRVITVALPPDTVKPTVTLTGPDTVPVTALENFQDPGAACMDDRDGSLAASLSGFLPSAAPPAPAGLYQAVYTCTDMAGNQGQAVRIVKSGLYTTYLDDIADGQIDTTSCCYNQGLTPAITLTPYSKDPYLSFVRFDLSKVNKAGLKSAKLRYLTWGTQPQWPGTRFDFMFYVYALKSDWVEGTGNWYYHRNGWQNSGNKLLQYYGMPDWVKAKSTDPATFSGIADSNHAFARMSNLNLVSTQKANLYYDSTNGIDFIVNPYNKLVVVEIDVTDYVKNADPGSDFGFHVKFDGPVGSRRLGFLTREAGDGTLGPKLMLSY